jgi:outer membrane cobalamin receptor
MPNSWETTHGFDMHNPADNTDDPDKDGYTNIEEQLNGTDPHVADVRSSDLCLFMPLVNR